MRAIFKAVRPKFQCEQKGLLQGVHRLKQEDGRDRDRLRSASRPDNEVGRKFGDTAMVGACTGAARKRR